MKVLVTGGGGFVGSHLVERLTQDGHDVFTARRRDYDLTSMEATARLFADARPELVYHLAAEVGGIGANRANPGRYWYANLIMGAHVLEQSRVHELRKLVIAGTVCAYPKYAPSPSARTISGTAIRRRRTRRTAWRRRRSSSAARPTASSTVSTRSSCSPPISTGRATTSTWRPHT